MKTTTTDPDRPSRRLRQAEAVARMKREDRELAARYDILLAGIARHAEHVGLA